MIEFSTGCTTWCIIIKEIKANDRKLGPDVKVLLDNGCGSDSKQAIQKLPHDIS